MTPAKIYQKRSLLKGLLNHHPQSGFVKGDPNLDSYSEIHENKDNPAISGLVQADQQSGLIEIGPRLDIQAGIDLLKSYKNIPQSSKTIRINLQGAKSAHGAVIQTLVAIQKSCLQTGIIFNLSGHSAELETFFQLAGLNELLMQNRGVETL